MAQKERDSLRTWILENCEEFREMQIVRHAKYVGTMIGPNGHLHRWTALRKKIIQRVMKINASTKSLVERLCDFKIYAISVLSLLDLYVHQIRQPSRPKTMPFSVQPQACTTLYRLTFLELAPYVVLVLTWWVFTPSALRLAIGLQHARPRLAEVLKKISAARGHNCTPIFVLSPVWEKEFLVPSMACSTANAFDIVSRLDRNGTLVEVPQNKKQKIATGLLLDKQNP